MPLRIAIGPGNEHDSRRLLELVEGLDWRPDQLYADAAYDTEPIRRGLESMGIEPNIPVNISSFVVGFLPIPSASEFSVASFNVSCGFFLILLSFQYFS
jgi:hypothetical protein